MVNGLGVLVMSVRFGIFAFVGFLLGLFVLAFVFCFVPLTYNLEY